MVALLCALIVTNSRRCFQSRVFWIVAGRDSVFWLCTCLRCTLFTSRPLADGGITPDLCLDSSEWKQGIGRPSGDVAAGLDSGCVLLSDVAMPSNLQWEPICQEFSNSACNTGAQQPLNMPADRGASRERPCDQPSAGTKSAKVSHCLPNHAAKNEL